MNRLCDVSCNLDICRDVMSCRDTCMEIQENSLRANSNEVCVHVLCCSCKFPRSLVASYECQMDVALPLFLNLIDK